MKKLVCQRISRFDFAAIVFSFFITMSSLFRFFQLNQIDNLKRGILFSFIFIFVYSLISKNQPLLQFIPEKRKCLLIASCLGLLLIGLFIILPYKVVPFRTSHTLTLSVPETSVPVKISNLVDDRNGSIPLPGDGTAQDNSQIVINSRDSITIDRTMIGGMSFTVTADQTPASLDINWDGKHQTLDPLVQNKNVVFSTPSTTWGKPSFLHDAFAILNLISDFFCCFGLLAFLILISMKIHRTGFRSLLGIFSASQIISWVQLLLLICMAIFINLGKEFSSYFYIASIIYILNYAIRTHEYFLKTTHLLRDFFTRLVQNFKRFISSFPLNKYFLVIFIFAVVISVYHIVVFPLRVTLSVDVPEWFPVSVFTGPRFNAASIPYILLFIVLFCHLLRKNEHINEYVIVAAGCVLIVTGNLIQGGFAQGFLFPFGSSEGQYFNDVVEMGDWRSWLTAYNNDQLALASHSVTHPPFAVLIHKLFYSLTGNSKAGMAILMSLTSMTSTFLFLAVLKCLKVDQSKRKLLALLFTVIPAINIYTAVSLDGVILTTSLLFLFGLVMILTGTHKKWLGYFLMALGFLLTGSMTYISTAFLAGVGGIIALHEIIFEKKWHVFWGMVITAIGFLAFIAVSKFIFHYDYFQSFFTSAIYEKSRETIFTNEWLTYISSRFEDVGEILLMLSFGLLAVWPKVNFKDLQTKPALIIAASGIMILAIAFLAGLFRTGETARGCLFIYPFLLLLFLDEKPERIKYAVYLAGFQTVVMQAIGSYFW